MNINFDFELNVLIVSVLFVVVDIATDVIKPFISSLSKKGKDETAAVKGDLV